MINGEGTKRDGTRYTIRFNPADPRHQRAMAALDAAGRRKATFIADAICEYLARYQEVETMPPMFHAKQTISFESSYDKANESENVGMAYQNDEADTVFSGNAPFSDDMRQTILSGLNMFNGQTEAN